MEMMRHFPAVRNLEFEGSFRSMDLASCSSLRKLHIKSTKRVKDLSLPSSLKTLTIAAAYCKNNPIVNLRQCNIEELIIRDANNVDWLKMYLQDQKRKLKVLRIYNTLVDKISMREFLDKVEWMEFLKT